MGTQRNIQVGDLVIFQHASYFEEWNGAVGLVVSPLRDRTAIDLHTMKSDRIQAYRVRGPDGVVACAKPHQLRPLSDPDESEAPRDESLEVAS